MKKILIHQKLKITEMVEEILVKIHGLKIRMEMKIQKLEEKNLQIQMS